MLNVLRFDRNEAVENGTIEIFSLIFKLEITANFIGILYYMLNVCIDYRTRGSMNNIRRIHQFVYVTCPINHIVFIVEKILIIWDFKEGYNPNTYLFQIIQFIRLMTSSIGFMCLPAYAIERSLATYFLHDYEKENRSYIGYTMSFLIYLISIISVLVCTQFSTTFYPFLVLFMSNIISYIVNIINYKLNRYYYNCSLRKLHTYSLTERYQISENIQFAKFFHIFALTVAVFATVCSLLLMLTSLSFTASEKNIFLLSFDTIYTIFILVCPYLHYKNNTTWQHEFKKCLKLYTSEVKCSSLAIGKPSLQLKTTFGERMNVGKNVQTDVYFSQLTNSWNTTKPNNIPT
ncbi:Serpentine Receptor, class E (Epsilon) [Caenorhabditis elegans]|uniref:Serpentine Receptor, class E (Epsilon) n=1 Tax=Caenorhabditis elegans TaxID=6239 RepID=Q9U2L3_CAEEL|nr:Serpentine Receptor, class E (Epsilon) [Caenorhabditis elegans]CAB60493.4 Serpentine Receptor, class E (Epsilon) [Caenorhabditis elegans]|eukprot:NP_502325.4 Serpentine Receptor, class E (epsilon) [Caenorhabditis elegans]